MHIRNKAQAANQRHMSNARDRAGRADRPPSTAWLAAQEAFSAPRPAAAEPALVMVRKARAPELALNGGVPTAAATSVLPERPARVFRVVAVGSAAAAIAADASPAALATAMPQAEALMRSPSPSPRRRKRLHGDKHPGPVTHILQAMRESAEPVGQAPVRCLSPAEELVALRAMMARLDAVFNEISRARVFHFLA